MMRVGIIGAMDVEVTSIKERMTIEKIEQVGDNTYCLGKIGDTEVVVARCGIGKVNAAICATTMCVKYEVTHILNTGIDIDAQPPGKAVQNNMLFSGGEKSLIALCVLFAILKIKPVPMVILDEVEAALDPGNVERFAQYLHHYTHQTQFIVVTHRPGTMENADVLYGVTMQNQGVSQMLKVTLHDALNMADTTTEEVQA